MLTQYKPYTHNLQQLGSMAILQNEVLIDIFLQDNKSKRRCFQLLKQAYVKARYPEHYKITEEELNYLSDRVTYLQTLTKRLCEEKIKSFD